jgi:hypothetical protein
LGFAGHDLDSSLIAWPIIQQPLHQPASMPAISIITGTQSGKPPEMPHNRSISLSRCLITSLPRKHVLGLFVIEMLYRHEPPLTLTLPNALSPQACQSTTQPEPSIYESEPKRGNMLEFNNFRMVNVMELVSKSQKSQRSQRFQGPMFVVDVHW